MPYFKNDTINILFIHIPKTGGSSLELYFSNKYKIPLDNKSLHGYIDIETNIKNKINSSLQHMTYQTIFLNKEFFIININNIEIITIVRNPYERIMSDLFALNKVTIYSTKEEVYNIIQIYINETLDNHNIPQYLFITDHNKQLIPNIKILKTESLQQDMINLGHKNFDMKFNCNSNKVNYYDYLNDNSIKFINDFYNDDFTPFPI